MRRWTSAVVAATTLILGSLVLATSPATAAACSFPTPSPLPSADYRIETAADLQWLSVNSSQWDTENWTQTTNIDMGNCEWTVTIGDAINSFQGSYDGGGFEISGLTISRPGVDYSGLFGIINGNGEVRNVGFSGDVTGGSATGGLVGSLRGSAAVRNSYATGTVTASGAGPFGSIGGLVGQVNATNSVISGSFATGNVSAANGSFVGGLVGSFLASGTDTISNSYATGTVTGVSEVGGLVGRVSGAPAVLSNTYAIGSVTGTSDVGGLIGEAASATASNLTASYWNTDSGPGSSAGGPGIMGKTTSQMTDIATYSTWSISDSNLNSTWAICPGFNSGYPFLSVFYSTDPCSGGAPATGSSYTPPRYEFSFWLPDGSECTNIGPVTVIDGTDFTLPGADADCHTMPGSSVGGWTIPVEPGFTGAGSESLPFNPGHVVHVSDSQRFTVVPVKPVLTITLDANVNRRDSCTPTGVDYRSDDDMYRYVWVPRSLFDLARLPDQASCQPDGYRLAGWNTAPNASGEMLSLNGALPQDWATNPTNDHRLYAVWTNARVTNTR